jgi:hypothetical protein
MQATVVEIAMFNRSTGEHFDKTNDLTYSLVSLVWGVIRTAPLGIPKGAEVTKADVVMTNTTTSGSSDYLYLIDNISSSPATAVEAGTNLVYVGEPLATGTMAVNAQNTTSILASLQLLMLRPDWSENATIRLQHRRTSSVGTRTIRTHNEPDPISRLRIEYEYSVPVTGPDIRAKIDNQVVSVALEGIHVGGGVVAPVTYEGIS